MVQLNNVWSTLKTIFTFYEFQRYLRARRIYHYAPYPLKIYEQCLKSLKSSPSHQLVPFLAYEGIDRERDRVFVRHDVDTQQCIKNLPETMEIDQRLKIEAGIYLRVDDEEYSAGDHRDMLLRYREQEFEIGLHSLCYTKEDYIQEFQRETEKFKSLMGFQPRSFSVHGLGSFRLETRTKFYQEIIHCFHQFGYDTGDIPTLRTYKHTIHDCHLDAQNRRFLYDDFLCFPRFSSKRKRYLILTHPCYWKV